MHLPWFCHIQSGPRATRTPGANVGDVCVVCGDMMMTDGGDDCGWADGRDSWAGEISLNIVQDLFRILRRFLTEKKDKNIDYYV